MHYSLTLQEFHLEQLRSLTIRGDGRERAALILCGHATIGRDPWEGQSHRRLISREIIPVPDEEVTSSSALHVTCQTRTFAQLLKRAKDENLVIGFVHSHPDAALSFSPQDNDDEPYLCELAQNRNGPLTEILSLVVTPAGHQFGRVWSSKIEQMPLSLIRIVGSRIGLAYEGRFDGLTPECFHRQALAFGPALHRDLTQLRIGIVGCGATGSATGMLLARLGVQKLAVIDKDVVELTNLNRLHGASRQDAEEHTPKVIVIQRHLEGMGLGTQVIPYQSWLGDPGCRDLLRSCDVVFGCTDDHDGRMLLNRFAYFYLAPVFDMGVDIGVADDDPPRVLNADGRVSVLVPGARCLLCYNIINSKTAYEDQLQRNNPAEFKRQQVEQYVRGGGRPDPAVVTFTTDVASMAVDELIHRLTGYRKVGSAAHHVRKFHLLEDKHPGPHPFERCPICQDAKYWGRGDVEPFLDRVG